MFASWFEIGSVGRQSGDRKQTYFLFWPFQLQNVLQCTGMQENAVQVEIECYNPYYLNKKIVKLYPFHIHINH